MYGATVPPQASTTGRHLEMGQVLDRINKPSDLQGLDNPQLKQLAREIRDTKTEVITKSGGHLASNLGVVELTLALHRVFESPLDKIVWDTSNQCYTHKLLTGRREAFKSIRPPGQRWGFPASESHPKAPTTLSGPATPARGCPLRWAPLKATDYRGTATKSSRSWETAP